MSDQGTEAYSNQFLLVVGENRRLTFNVQTANITEVTQDSTQVSANTRNVPIPGNGINYETAKMRFMLSEDLWEWVYLFKWQKRLLNSLKPLQDATINSELITIGAGNEFQTRFRYKSMFPTRIGGLEYSIIEDQPELLTCQAEFAFIDFEVITPDGEVINNEWNGEL